MGSPYDDAASREQVAMSSFLAVSAGAIGPARPQDSLETAATRASPHRPQISPRALEDDFWEGFSQRVWHWQDSVTSGCTVALLPLMWTRTPSWQLGVSYILVYCLKAFHLAALWRAHKAAAGRGETAHRYNFAMRNAFVVTERALRIVASYFVGRDFDNVGLGKLYLLASVPGGSSTIKRMGAALTAVKRLVMGTGTTVALWQAFCQPTVWALEPLLLLPLVVM
jgi:hypothetical protein